MAHKIGEKMTVLHRAKQFVPFAAVKGLNTALAEKEKLYSERLDLSEDAALMIDYALGKLNIGDKVKVTCYNGSEYKTTYGEIIGIDTLKQKLKLTGIDINFSDILSVSGN